MTKFLAIVHTATPDPIRDADVAEALGTSDFERFEVRPPQRATMADFDEAYDWQAAADLQHERREALRDRCAAEPDLELAYFGMAPIPLVFHFGTLLGQRARVRIFQHHHVRREWRWIRPNERPSLRLERTVPRPESSEVEIVLRVGLSYAIHTETTMHIGGQRARYADLHADIPQVDLIGSANQLDQVGREFRDVLDHIADYPRVRVRHLVASVTVGAALIMGMQVNPTIDYPIQTWNYLASRNPARIPALKLGTYVDPPRVLLLAASPVNKGPIRVVTELRGVREIVRAAGIHHDDIPAATTDDLIDTVRRMSPTIIHIGAHGGSGHASGYALTLHDQQQESHDIRVEDLHHLLQSLPGLRCIVFGTCFGALAATEVGSATRSAIGFTDEVDDDQARRFAERFWISLSEGCSIADAYRDGRIVLDDETRVILSIHPPLEHHAHAFVPFPK